MLFNINFASTPKCRFVGKINESGNKKQEVVEVNKIYMHRFLKPIKLKNLHKNGINNKKEVEKCPKKMTLEHN